MPIKNYTTQVSVDKTLAEIQGALRMAGASAVMVTYGDGGEVDSVSFKLRMPKGEIAFRLPGRADAVLRVLERQNVEKRFRNREQASRVAWRIVKDWITAQLALVQAEVASLPEVFLPYAEAGGGQTLYEKLLDDPGTLLEMSGN